MIVSLIGGIVLFGLLAVDLITKAWAYAVQIKQENFFLGFIRLSYLEGGNKGMAMGWFGGSEIAMKLVTVFTVFLIVGMVALFFTIFKKNIPARMCLAVIEAGAIGNLIDRLVLGYVRDFIDVSRIGFFVCNFADFFITFGAVALFLVILFIGKDAIFPITGKWREEKKLEDRKKSRLKAEKKAAEPQAAGAEDPAGSAKPDGGEETAAENEHETD